MTQERENRGVDNEVERINFEDIARLVIESTLREGSHPPYVIIDGSKRIMHGGVPYLPETHDERMQFMYVAGQLAASREEVGKLRQVFMINEGWMSVPKENNELPTMLPSQDPNRKEVLIISGLEFQQQVKYLKLFEMLRDKEGILIGLTEVITGKEEGGRFDVPLLDSFHKGYQVALQARYN